MFWRRKLKSVAPLQLCEARFLELGIVVAVDVIDADDLVAAIEKALRRVEADEPRSAGNQEFHASIILPACRGLVASTALSIEPPPNAFEPLRKNLSPPLRQGVS